MMADGFLSLMIIPVNSKGYSLADSEMVYGGGPHATLPGFCNHNL